jgi:hypothetical protein
VISLLEPSISQTWLSRNAQHLAAPQKGLSGLRHFVAATSGIYVPHEIGQTASPIIFQSHPVRC